MQPSSVFKKSAFYKFGTTLFLVILLGAVVSAVLLYSILPKELPLKYTDALHALQALSTNLYLKTYIIYIPIALFVFIGVFALSQSMTKKIVTPLRATSEFTKVLGMGDFSKRPPVENDNLSPLIERLNELINVYKDRLGSIKEATAKLEAVQKNIGNYLEGGSQAGLKDELKELIDITEKIDKILQKIRA